MAGSGTAEVGTAAAPAGETAADRVPAPPNSGPAERSADATAGESVDAAAGESFGETGDGIADEPIGESVDATAGESAGKSVDGGSDERSSGVPDPETGAGTSAETAENPVKKTDLGEKTDPVERTAPGGALPAVAAEAEPDDPPTPRARMLGWSRSPAALLVGLLIGLLGFGLAVQVRSNTSTSGLPAARQEDLVRILDDLSSREDRLRRQIAELEAARTRLSTTGDSSSTALEEARKRSAALGILAGTVPAQGPGIQLTLTDPERRLAAEDLLDTVEELRAAGAEAIQVGGVRIGLDSSFTATDRGLAVDGVTVASPYQIVAIGDPPTLATAMEIPGGVADTVKRAGGNALTEQGQRVVIRSLRAVRTPRYSQPTN